MLFFKIIGALTSKPFAFTFRSWELSTKKFVDFLDVLALDILIESRQHKILRVLPLFSYSLPKNIWLNDRTRHFLPSLKKHRLFRLNYLYKISNKRTNKKYLNISNKFLLMHLTSFLFTDNIHKYLDIVSNNHSFQNLMHLENFVHNSSTISQKINFNKRSDALVKKITRINHAYFEPIPNFFSLTDILSIGLDLRRISPTFLFFYKIIHKTLTVYY